MGLSSFFSSLFGKAKQGTEDLGRDVSNMADTAVDKVESFAKEAGEKVTELADKAEQKFEDLGVKDSLNNLVDSAKETAAKAEQKFEELGVKDSLNNLVDSAKETAAKAADWVEDKAIDVKEAVSGVVDNVENKVEEVTGNSAEEKATDTPAEEEKPAE